MNRIVIMLNLPSILRRTFDERAIPTYSPLIPFLSPHYSNEHVQKWSINIHKSFQTTVQNRGPHTALLLPSPTPHTTPQNYTSKLHLILHHPSIVT